LAVAELQLLSFLVSAGNTHPLGESGPPRPFYAIPSNGNGKGRPRGQHLRRRWLEWIPQGRDLTPSMRWTQQLYLQSVSLGALSSTDAQVVPSSSGSDLLEVLRQAEEKSVNLRGEMRAMAKAAAYDQLKEGLVRSVVAEWSAHVQEQRQSSIEPPSAAIASAENGNTCVVCLAAPKNSLLLPCKHLAMCAECTKAIFALSSQPQCPVCRSRIVDCIDKPSLMI
jgi:hypothetical protein